MMFFVLLLQILPSQKSTLQQDINDDQMLYMPDYMQKLHIVWKITVLPFPYSIYVIQRESL